LTRTVLVTGGTSGIGRAIARRFAAGQADVVITGRNPDTVGQAADELGVSGAVCDAADSGQVAALASGFGELDVLVNAAGGLPPEADGAGPALAAVAAEWHASLRQNLLTAVLTTASLQGKLCGGSCIISIGSIGAERRGGSYGAAKAALGAWNAALSAQLAPNGVTCNVISAGYIAGTNFFHGQLSDERHRALVAETHNKRPGEVDDIAEMAWFLASDGARHITGQTIHVNGGAFTTR
jgi:3-oxoacyl-[acyl-carrier protein] reductase